MLSTSKGAERYFLRVDTESRGRSLDSPPRGPVFGKEGSNNAQFRLLRVEKGGFNFPKSQNAIFSLKGSIF